MTEHQADARRRYAEIFRSPEKLWTVVCRPQPGCWYDFLDPETGKCGQCLMGEDGRWKQAPLGVQPVILAFRKGRRREQKE